MFARSLSHLGVSSQRRRTSYWTVRIRTVANPSELLGKLDFARHLLFMELTICNAIATFQTLRFVYRGGVRRIEPYCHGFGEQEQELRLGRQLGGASVSENPRQWRIFSVSEMVGIDLAQGNFAPVDGYNPTAPHPSILDVHCSVKKMGTE